MKTESHKMEKNVPSNSAKLFFSRHQKKLCVSVSEPADSVPTTQFPKRKGGDYRAMASGQGVLNEG